MWESAGVDCSDHRHFHMIPPLSHLPLLLSQLDDISVLFLSHPDLRCSHVSVTKVHSGSTSLTSSIITVSVQHTVAVGLW